MSIWHKEIDLEEINKLSKNTLIEHLNIKIIEYNDEGLIGVMPVDSTTHQPFGLLHGGASCALAETLGSVASNLCIDLEKQYSVGIEINANHIRGVESGVVKGVAENLHLGRLTHVWEIKIYNEKKQLVSISRLTVAVVEKKIS